MVTFLFSVHNYYQSKAICRARQGRARAVDLHLTWRALV